MSALVEVLRAEVDRLEDEAGRVSALVERLRAGCLLAEERENNACRQLHETERQRDAAREDAERFEREAEQARADCRLLMGWESVANQRQALLAECLALLERAAWTQRGTYAQAREWSHDANALRQRLRAALGQQKGTPQ